MIDPVDQRESNQVKDAQDGGETAPANNPDNDVRLGRRFFLLKAGAVLGAVAAAAVLTSSPAEAQRYRRVSDSDPGDRTRVIRLRSGITNGDRFDRAGYGRRIVRRQRRVTDVDPRDRAGRPLRF